MKKLISTICIFAIMTSGFVGCSNSEDGDMVQESATETSEPVSVNNRLHEVCNDCTQLWNSVICEVNHYAGHGTGATGNEVDIEALVAGMDDYFNPVTEDKVFVDSLDGEYSDIIVAFDQMYDEAMIIYDHLSEEIPEPNSELSYIENIDLFHEKYMDLYSLIIELPYDTTTSSETVPLMEVEQGFFTVSITIPSMYINEEPDQESNILENLQEGILSTTVNEDGSVTIVMTRERHNEMMQELSVSIDEALQELVGSEDYPNFAGITHNDDYTDFTIEYTGDTLTVSDSFSAITFYFYGGFYGMLNGTETDNVHVTFVNAETGEIIDEANSNEAYQN